MAFTKGIPLNPEPELLGGFFVSTETPFAGALKGVALVRRGGDAGLNDDIGGGVVLTRPGEIGFPIGGATFLGVPKVFLLAADFAGSLNAEGGSLGFASSLRASLSEVGLSASDTSWLGSSFEPDDTYFID